MYQTKTLNQCECMDWWLGQYHVKHLEIFTNVSKSSEWYKKLTWKLTHISFLNILKLWQMWPTHLPIHVWYYWSTHPPIQIWWYWIYLYRGIIDPPTPHTWTFSVQYISNTPKGILHKDRIWLKFIILVLKWINYLWIIGLIYSQ